jgi:hypothetical protein
VDEDTNIGLMRQLSDAAIVRSVVDEKNLLGPGKTRGTLDELGKCGELAEDGNNDRDKRMEVLVAGQLSRRHGRPNWPGRDEEYWLMMQKTSILAKSFVWHDRKGPSRCLLCLTLRPQS